MPAAGGFAGRWARARHTPGAGGGMSRRRPPGYAGPVPSGGQSETTQIVPTILRLLGLNPRALQAVRIEHTPVLPA